MSQFLSSKEMNECLSYQLSVGAQFCDRLKSKGQKEFGRLNFDYFFESNSRAHLEKLKSSLTDIYGYQVTGIQSKDDIWELGGQAARFFFDSESFKYWTMDMARLGFSFDCLFTDWGALQKNDDIEVFEPAKENEYFGAAMVNYEKGFKFGAYLDFRRVLMVNPENMDALYSIAILKDELFLSKEALADYDTVIELAPDFLSAWTNRGALKDDMGDHRGAIADYDHVLEAEPDTANALLNRGNSKFNLKDLDGALEDWKLAASLGEEIAAQQMAKYFDQRR